MKEKHPDIYFIQNTWLDGIMVSHERRVYGYFDLLGELGGVMEVLVLFFGFFLFPISEHSFYLNAIKKLFFAKTKDDDIFVTKSHAYLHSKTKKTLEKSLHRRLSISQDNNRYSNDCEIKSHRYVRLRLLDDLKLFFSNHFQLCFCDCLWNNKSKMQRLYEKGAGKIEQELDIVQIMNDLRHLKILMKSSLMTRKIEFEIAHSR